MQACCVRSASTVPRPISTPTYPRITTSTSKTVTNWSTFRIRIWCCRRCRKCPKATRSPGSTWWSGCARSADRISSLLNLIVILMVRSASWCVSNHEAVHPSRRGQAAAPRDEDCSLHLLVDVDAPQPLLLDPAIEAIAGDATPACRAPLDLGHDAGLQAGRDRAGFVGALVEWREFVLGLHGDNRGAAPGKQ